MPDDTFRVGLTADFLKPDGELALGEIGLEQFDNHPHIQYEFLQESGPELSPAATNSYDALIVLAPRVTAATLDGSQRSALIARFGVGYDGVDVEACNRNGVLLTITPDAVRRPVATSAIALLLALTHRIPVKDQLTRTGRWSDKLDYMGVGLTGRTLGLVGFGNIGQEIHHLARPLGMRHVASDPYADPAHVRELGAELVELDTLCQQADFLIICCLLTDETRHMFDAERLALLKPTAFLINVARGPVVDQTALTDVLARKAIAGAALDVFETEPIDPDDPLLKLDNAILTPHAVCWTDELFRNIGRSACAAVVDVSTGSIPAHVVNADILDQQQVQLRLDGYRKLFAASQP